MSILLKSVAVLLGIGCCTCLSSAVRAQELSSESLCLSTSNLDDPKSESDSESLVAVRSGKKPNVKRRFSDYFRHIEREWPRIFSSYVQPAVRTMLADQQRGNSLALSTTIFRNNNRGLQLDGGVGRNFFNEREARLQLSVHF